MTITRWAGFQLSKVRAGWCHWVTYVFGSLLVKLFSEFVDLILEDLFEGWFILRNTGQCNKGRDANVTCSYGIRDFDDAAYNASLR
jgi:hypothetical protein